MTGVVVDAGDGATYVVPVADGYVIGSSIKSIPIAGKDVTLFIQQLMRVSWFWLLAIGFSIGHSRYTSLTDSIFFCHVWFIFRRERRRKVRKIHENGWAGRRKVIYLFFFFPFLWNAIFFLRKLCLDFNWELTPFAKMFLTCLDIFPLKIWSVLDEKFLWSWNRFYRTSSQFWTNKWKLEIVFLT